MKLRIYPSSDTLYVEFSDEAYSYSRELDDDRQVDYDAERRPIGITFLSISRGVSLHDVPYREELAPLLARYNIRELVS